MALAVAAELPRQPPAGQHAATVESASTDRADGAAPTTSAPFEVGAERQHLTVAEEARQLALKEGLEQRIRRHLQNHASPPPEFSLLSISGIAYTRDRVRMHGYALYGETTAEGDAAGTEVQFIASFDKRSGRLESLSYQAAPPRAGDLVAELQSRESYSAAALVGLPADAF